jgi:hypothetical protein
MKESFRQPAIGYICRAILSWLLNWAFRRIRGPIGAYMEGVRTFLQQQASSPDFTYAATDVAAFHRLVAEFRNFQDALKIGLINGDVFTNIPQGMTAKEANNKTTEFFANWKRYATDRADQIAKVNRLQRALDEAGLASTGGFVSLLGSDKVSMADKIRASEEFAAQNPDRNLVSKDQPGSLDALKRFLEGDPNSTPFTRIDPKDVPGFAGTGFPVFRPDLVPQLPGLLATPRGPLVLGTPAFDPKNVPYPGGFPQQPNFPPCRHRPRPSNERRRFIVMKATTRSTTLSPIG